MNSEFSKGELVRIKTPAENEAEGHHIMTDSAISEWQNQICVVEEVIPGYSFESGYAYKLSFVNPPEKISVSRLCLSDYIWQKHWLAPYETKVFPMQEFEQLIGENVL